MILEPDINGNCLYYVYKIFFSILLDIKPDQKVQVMIFVYLSVVTFTPVGFDIILYMNVSHILCILSLCSCHQLKSHSYLLKKI